MKRIYFVAFEVMCSNGLLRGHQYLVVSGPFCRHRDEIEGYLRECLESDSCHPQSDVRISGYKWAGLIAFGRKWEWN